MFSIQNNNSSTYHRIYLHRANNLQQNTRHLSSGRRINSAADDATGLAISQRLKAYNSGITSAMKNVQDGISLIQTAEGGMKGIINALQRMRELVIKRENNILPSSEKGYINDEILQLKSQIESIIKTTEYNNKNLLDGITEKKLVDSYSITSDYTLTPTAPGQYAVDINNIFEFNLEFESISIDQIKITASYLGSELGSSEVSLPLFGEKTVTLNLDKEIEDTQIVNDKIIEEKVNLDQISVDVFNIFGLQSISNINVNAGDISVSEYAMEKEEAQFNLHTGPQSGETMTVVIDNITPEALLLEDGLLLGSDALQVIDQALDKVSSARSRLGSYQNRLGFRTNYLENANINHTAAISKITDTNMAADVSSLVKNQILMQGSLSMIGKEKLQAANVLKLIGGTPTASKPAVKSRPIKQDFNRNYQNYLTARKMGFKAF